MIGYEVQVLTASYIFVLFICASFWSSSSGSSVIKLWRNTLDMKRNMPCQKEWLNSPFALCRLLCCIWVTLLFECEWSELFTAPQVDCKILQFSFCYHYSIIIIITISSSSSSNRSSTTTTTTTTIIIILVIVIFIIDVFVKWTRIRTMKDTSQQNP